MNVRLFIFCLGLLPLSLSAQKLDKAKLNRYFDSLEKHDKFMGSVAVSKGGTPLYARSLGFSDVETLRPSGPDTRYRIGSISKTFTAVLVLKAVEAGKLSLQQTIDTFFPNLPHAAQITVGHLLLHQSGIHNFTNDENYLSWHTEAQTEASMVERITRAGSDFKPGSKTEYSNSNYVLLTYILERTFGEPYAVLLQSHITRPAGLKNTYLGGKLSRKKHEAYSYFYKGSYEKAPETDISIPLGAGGIVSTPADLVRFGEALFGGDLLQPESLEKMKSLENGFGMGLFQMPFYDITGYGHTGGIDGFSAVFGYFEAGDVAYALCSNGNNMNTNDISIAVLSAVYNKPYELPTLTPYAVSEEALDQYTGVYSAPEFPLKITITTQDNTLTAQATGQSAFPLQATAEHTFTFDAAGILMEFNPAEQTMLFEQGGAAFTLRKE